MGGRRLTACLCASLAMATACTGTLTTPDRGGDEEGGDSPTGQPDATPGGGGSDTVRTVEIEGPAVRAHVQAFANATCAAVSSCRPSTYDGHDPSADRALDFLVSDTYGELPSDENALGDATASYALAQQEAAGITYVIWRQRYNDGGGWEAMEDRGSLTENHYDHVHVSFDETL